MENKNILVLTNNEEIINFVKNSLCHLCFSIQNIKEYKDLHDIKYDLLIIDDTYVKDFPEISKILKTPILMIFTSKIDNFDFKVFDVFTICDFITKPYIGEILASRVRILSKIESSYLTLNSYKFKALTSLWDLLNYSNIYVVVFDRDFIIQLINWPLSKVIGFDDEKIAIGKKWDDYIPKYDKALSKNEYQKIIEDKKSYSELTIDVGFKDNYSTVKWFNSYINSTVNWIFCIGVPITKDITFKDNIDSVRSYFRDIIIKDRQVIQGIKDFTNSIKNDEVK